MTTFLKFPSLTNHYQARFIQKALETFPGLLEEQYIITEKLHGANIQVYFEPGEPYRVGSRNHWLETDSKFFNVRSALGKVSPVLTSAWNWSLRTGKTLRLFGELYGGNIQRDINYGPEQSVRFFAAMIDGEMISAQELLWMPIHWGTRRNFVPILALGQTWEEAIAFSVDQDSLLTPSDHAGPNLIEGVVIQPYSKVYHLPSGASFVLKKKNEQFLVSPREARPKVAMETAVVALRAEFRSYITNARIDSVISQNGPFTRPQQLGEYIVLILNDAKEEFARYNTEAEALDKKTHKYIFNAGGLIANMLKARL